MLSYPYVLYLEAVFELLADKVENNGIYAGVDCSKVDAEVVQDQQEAKNTDEIMKKYIFNKISVITIEVL